MLKISIIIRQYCNLMNFRHLIIPGSFFPSLGGAQGSMLNFVQLLGNKKLIHVALGLRGFKYSAFKKDSFLLLFLISENY